MADETAPYIPAAGDLIKLAGFPRRYNVIDVGPCRHERLPDQPACGITSVLIDLPSPAHPVWVWINRRLHRSVSTTQPTWVHAIGAKLSYESVKDDVDQSIDDTV